MLAEVGRLGYHGGIALGRWYPDLADCILIAVTEKRTKAEIDGLAEAYNEAMGALAELAAMHGILGGSTMSDTNSSQ